MPNPVSAPALASGEFAAAAARNPVLAAAAAGAEAVRRGREVFDRQSCGSCHAPPAYTSVGTYDVGLRDETGNTHFNPPSLRGVGRGGPYFHDNRVATLEEVFAPGRHQLRGELSKRELADLLAFLRSL